MPLKHADIWRAIDRLAERHKLSPSGLARKAGLSPTVFNPSKRAANNRKRWPSTESIAKILQTTGASLGEFVALAGNGAAPAVLPLLGLAQAGRAGAFDEDGKPSGRGWDQMRFPDLRDPHAFVLEINDKGAEPLYRAGDRIVVSPAEKPRRGDRVVLRSQKGAVMIGQLGRESAQKVELISLNPAFPPVTLSPREIEWMYRIVWVSQ
ncbi:MAG TPA: helix-turn-helix transcriptional regulator [Alphaproteobacteria bacterium]|nr:helix-turn-helix transcriptional regulator [Alphaproteobacteria bacterium]